MNNIIKPAKSLKPNLSAKKELLLQTATDFLYQINFAIEGSNDNNNGQLCIRIPISVRIPTNINRSSFKVELYHMVVTELENKGYVVKISNFEDEAPMLTITWSQNTCANNLDEMVSYLNKISK